eukprot:3461334-Rhodomonas_salina.4
MLLRRRYEMRGTDRGDAAIRSSRLMSSSRRPLRFRLEGSWLRLQGSQASLFTEWGSGFGVSHSGLGMLHGFFGGGAKREGSDFGVRGSGFRVQGFTVEGPGRKSSRCEGQLVEGGKKRHSKLGNGALSGDRRMMDVQAR